jgi:hypothetical protein
MLVAGTAAVFLALGGASAYAVPPNSPYATMVPPGAADYNAPGYDYAPDYNQRVIVEGRSAYVEEPGYVYRAPAYRPDYGYGYDYDYRYRYRAPFPFSLLPWNW